MDTNTIKLKQICSLSLGGHLFTLSGLPCYNAVMNAGTTREVNPNGDFWSGQMYAQYFELAEPVAKYPLMFWHGGGLSGSCWETTPDGREGWHTYFLRQGHSVYISDAVERGRASWSRYPEIYTTEAIFRPFAEAWESFRIGPEYHTDPHKRETFKNSQYPKEAFEKSMLAAIPRWSSNSAAIQAAYDEYVQTVGEVVIISHSQGCAFAAHTALKYPHLVKALVFVEAAAMPDPADYDLNRIKDIPQLFLWGDFLDMYPTWNKTDKDIASYYKKVRRYFETLRTTNSHAEWLELPDIGIHGNTHMLMHDKNSLEIAALIQQWLVDKGLMSKMG